MTESHTTSRVAAQFLRAGVDRIEFATDLGTVRFVSEVRPLEDERPGQVMVDVAFDQETGIATIWLDANYMVQLAR